MKNDDRHPITITIANLIYGLVSKPEAAKIIQDREGDHINIYITPHQSDFSVCCGKQGRFINALKFIGERAGQRRGLQVKISLEESFNGQPEDRPFVQVPEFDVDHAVRMVADLAAFILPKIKPEDIRHERLNDKLKVKLPIDASDPDQVMCVSAISDVTYSWGYHQGMAVAVNYPGYQKKKEGA